MWGWKSRRAKTQKIITRLYYTIKGMIAIKFFWERKYIFTTSIEKGNVSGDQSIVSKCENQTDYFYINTKAIMVNRTTINGFIMTYLGCWKATQCKSFWKILLLLFQILWSHLFNLLFWIVKYFCLGSGIIEEAFSFLLLLFLLPLGPLRWEKVRLQRIVKVKDYYWGSEIDWKGEARSPDLVQLFFAFPSCSFVDRQLAAYFLTRP